MNFITYLDNRFQEVSMEAQKLKSYSLTQDAEAGSLRWTMLVTIAVMKILYMPKGIFGFFAMKLGMIKQPLPAVILEHTKKEEAAKVAKEIVSNLRNIKEVGNEPA